MKKVDKIEVPKYDEASVMMHWTNTGP